MTKKFDITGRNTSPPAGPPPATGQDMARFIAGAELQTTMTVQIPARLKRVLKRQALEHDTTIKNLLIEILEAHFAEVQ
ncbi:MAG: hypothetical protein V3U27_13655 [Candidatus Tectomicrobia bacterium]